MMLTFLGLRPAPVERSALARRPGPFVVLVTSGVLAGLVVLTATAASAQDSVVAGTVVAAVSLRPIEAAQITVVETGVEVHTDALGRFAFDHLTAAVVTLKVRRVGYRPLTQIVMVGDRAVRLILTETAVELDALVVTGTPGETQARAIGNAIGEVSAAKVLQDAPVADVQQLLGGRVPGVTITSYQGNVGTGGATRVRGVSSLFLPNEPLLYVDGMRVDNNPNAGPSIRSGRQVARINDFNPEDIERVEVIKGPAAATLDGAEASRGVIQILTRRGTPGPARFALTVKQGANWFMNPGERLNLVFGKDSVTGALDSLNLYQQEVDAGRPIFTTGNPRAYGASVSGGSESVRYYASGDLDREEGMLWYNWRNRLSGRANLSLVPNNKLDIETRAGFVRNRMRLASQQANTYDVMTQLILGLPPGTDTARIRLRGFYAATPEDIATIDTRSSTDRITASVQLKHHPLSWFSQRLTLGMDIGDETSSTLFPSDPAGSAGPFFGLSLGDISVERLHVAVSSLDYSASVSVPFGFALRSVTSLGAQGYDRRVDNVTAHGSSLPVGITALSGAATTDAGGDVIQTRGVGVYGQQQLGWKNRVFFTAALRGDANSVFGENVDFVTYPKVSATWVLNEEPFWRGVLAHLNTVKLRAAWGRAGQQPDAFAAQRSYQPITGSGGVSALTPQNIGNPDLRPERGEELEIGFDAGAFGDRVGTTFTYYHQRIADAIVPRLLAPSGGFPGTQLVNLGKITNQGVELSIDTRLINRQSIAWDFGLAFATNGSRVVSMGGVPSIYLVQLLGTNLATGQWYVEGYPIGSYFLPLVVSASFNSSGKVVDIMCASGPDPGAPPAPCDNSAAQRLYAGHPTPSWTGSLRTGITLFGNLRLSGLIDFRGGNKLWYQTATYAVRQVMNTRAVNERTDPIFMAYDSLSIASVSGANARQGLIDGGFAKLREVSLTYTLPRSVARRLGAATGTFTVAGRNLLTLWQAQKEIYGVKVTDPENRSQFDQAGTIFNLLPQYAQFMTALRLSF